MFAAGNTTEVRTTEVRNDGSSKRRKFAAQVRDCGSVAYLLHESMYRRCFQIINPDPNVLLNFCPILLPCFQRNMKFYRRKIEMCVTNVRSKLSKVFKIFCCGMFGCGMLTICGTSDLT